MDKPAYILDNRWLIEAIEHLRRSGVIKKDIEISKGLNIGRSTLSNYLAGKFKATDKFKTMFYGRYGEHFRAIDKVNEGPQGYSRPPDLRIVPIIVDTHNEERIVFVDIKAQAGYAAKCHEVSYIKELPNFSLPFGRFRTGTYRAYEVEGDSMNETLDEGDVLICSFIEPQYWNTLKDGYIYVIIYEDQCYTKRIKRIDDFTLSLLSDNVIYEPREIAMEGIKEVWYMHRAFKWKFSPPGGVEKQLAKIDAKIDLLLRKK